MPEELDRITHDPLMMNGKACIRGMRITVAMIVRHISAGVTVERMLTDFPLLEQEDIQQALQYAAWLAEEDETRIVAA